MTQYACMIFSLMSVYLILISSIDALCSGGVPLNVMEVVGYPPEGATERVQAHKVQSWGIIKLCTHYRQCVCVY